MNAPESLATPLMTSADYRESLRRLKPVVYVDGRRVESVADEPMLAPGVRALGVSYDMAHDAALAPLMLATQSRHGSGPRTVPRMLQVDESAGDLLNKLEAVRVLCQETGCAQRYLAHDALAAICQTSARIDDSSGGSERRARFSAYLDHVQGNDLALGAWVVLLGGGLLHLGTLGYRRLLDGPEERPAPTDMAIAQHGIRRVRFLVAVLIASQYLLDPSRFDVLGESTSRLSMLVFSLGMLLGTNLLSIYMPTTVLAPRTLSAIELALDTGLVVLLTTLSGTSGVGWVLFALPIIEAAVRFRLAGALAHWMILTIVTMTARIWTDHLTPTANLLEDLESVLDQLSVLFLVVVPGAYVVEQLIGDVASQQEATGRALDRGRLLERVAEAGREVAQLGGRHLDAIVDGARNLGFDVVDVWVGGPTEGWRQLSGDVAVLPRPGDDGSGLRIRDLDHDALLVDREDLEITEVQSLVDHDLEAVLVQTVSHREGRRVVLRVGLRTGNEPSRARNDAFQLLAGQAAVALRNDQLLSEITSMHE
jgi:hypothetical protein